MTVRVGIAGIQGRMGREIAALAATAPEFSLVGGIARQPTPLGDGLNVVATVDELLPAIDVLIDFTAPSAAAAHAEACAGAGVALVCGTTGLDAGQMIVLRAASERIAVFLAANMSPGVNALLSVLPGLVRTLDAYDVEIVETHHRFKLDAPSGTALALARAVTEAGGGAIEDRVRYGREGLNKRSAAEIGIHAVRAGGNPGEHEVILAGDGEEIRLSHRAFSRAAYAAGALRAARLIAAQPPGWYDPSSLPGFL